MIVRVQQVLPFAVRSSIKNRFQMIASATKDKRTFDVPVEGVMYIFFLNGLPPATCNARMNRTSVFRLSCARRAFALHAKDSNKIRFVGHLQVNPTDVFLGPTTAAGTIISFYVK